MTEERIKPGDSVPVALYKMSDGNAGAISLLMDLLKEENGIVYILKLDSLNIYGSKIWEIYKDVCQEDWANYLRWIKEARIEKGDE